MGSESIASTPPPEAEHMGYASGIYMDEINEDAAKKYMQEFKYTEIDVKNTKANMDYRAYYDHLFR